MNTLTLVIATLCVLAIGYRCYALLFAPRVLGIGEHYVPAPIWITAGHRLSTVRPRRSHQANRDRNSSPSLWATADRRVATVR